MKITSRNKFLAVQEKAIFQNLSKLHLNNDHAYHYVIFDSNPHFFNYLRTYRDSFLTRKLLSWL